MQQDGPIGRCLRCFKSAALCVCADLVPIDNRTRIQIIQHPRERAHPLGTARMVALALQRCGLTSWGPRQPPGPLNKLAALLPERTALLYPHPDARDINDLAVSDRPDALVILDGTWHHAHTLHRASPWLQSLPHLSIQPNRPSRYRTLRREPAAHCISTVEAVVAALEALEPETLGLDGLLTAFDRMVDKQTPHTTGRTRPRRRRPPKRTSRAIPDSLHDAANLVLVYGECVTEEVPGAFKRHPLYWSALRPTTGEVFSSYVRCEDFIPSNRVLEHMGLARQDLERAPTADEVHQAWTAFCRPDDRIVSWNQGSLDFDLGRVVADRICLKTAWCNHFRSAAGHLDQVVEALTLKRIEGLAVSGRARRRLTQTLAVLTHLREVSTSGHRPEATISA